MPSLLLSLSLLAYFVIQRLNGIILRSALQHMADPKILAWRPYENKSVLEAVSMHRASPKAPEACASECSFTVHPHYSRRCFINKTFRSSACRLLYIRRFVVMQRTLRKG